MKISGALLIILGFVGAGFIYLYDLVVKHEPVVTLGPRSGPAMGIAVLLVIAGIIMVAVSKPSPRS